MNIFVLDTDIEAAAQMAVDRHVVKMPLESVQLLCSACHLGGVAAPYKLSHRNHPCAVWTRASAENYDWLVRFAYQQFREYLFRYGKTHASLAVLEFCDANRPRLPSVGLTPFALAMPDQYKTACPIESYRRYYVGEKSDLRSYKKRQPPSWFVPA